MRIEENLMQFNTFAIYKADKMKKILSLTGISLLIATTAIAQKPAVGCMDRAIRIQAEQTKQNLIKQGLEVYKEAMIGMDPNTPYPIAVELTQGVLYQIVNVGSLSATKIRFELLDGKDKRIDEKVLDRPVENNMVIYSFIPEKSDMYMLMLTQKVRKSTCGSIAILQKAGTAKSAEEKK